MIVKKALLRLVLVDISPVAFMGLLEAGLFLVGRFEPLEVVKKIRHEGREFWVTDLQTFQQTR